MSEEADLSRITVQRSGQACIRGLGPTVQEVLNMLAAGLTEDEILSGNLFLEKEDFPAVYAYASQAGRKPVSN
jgi:uncharacterized protein (DUF433 family)